MRAPVFVPTFDFRARVSRAAAALAAAGADALVISHLPNLRYLSGLEATAGQGLLTAAGQLYLLQTSFAPVSGSSFSPQPSPMLQPHDRWSPPLNRSTSSRRARSP